MTVVVSDTSVLCYLALIGRLDLLEALFTRVIIPEAVLHECLHPGAPEALRNAITPAPPPFLIVEKVDQAMPETAVLDAGESDAITLAWRHRADSLLLLDEKRGRAIAAGLGLRVRGILGIVTEAHRRSLLDFDEGIAQLRTHGFRVADALLAQARAGLGLK